MFTWTQSGCLTAIAASTSPNLRCYSQPSCAGTYTPMTLAGISTAYTGVQLPVPTASGSKLTTSSICITCILDVNAQTNQDLAVY